MLFDTHSHIYFEPLNHDEDGILARMKEHNITHSVQIGCNPEMNLQALSLAKKYPHFHATIGIHPTDGQDYSADRIAQEMWHLEHILTENRQYIVAIWETGLDYFHTKDDTQKATQAALFIEHVKLAQKYDLPIVIHCREAKEDMFALIWDSGLTRFVFHCYSEDDAFARRILELSSEAYFGFSGVITYKNAEKTRDAAYAVPLDRILIETDAPFLSPQAVRGQANEPSNVRFVLEKLCEIRPESAEIVEQTVYENSFRFYSIKA